MKQLIIRDLSTFFLDKVHSRQSPVLFLLARIEDRMACHDEVEGDYFCTGKQVWSILLLFVLVFGSTITIVWLISWHLQEWRVTGECVWWPDNEARLEALELEEENRLEKREEEEREQTDRG